jgi:hypothetical protein
MVGQPHVIVIQKRHISASRRSDPDLARDCQPTVARQRDQPYRQNPGGLGYHRTDVRTRVVDHDHLVPVDGLSAHAGQCLT